MQAVEAGLDAAPSAPMPEAGPYASSIRAAQALRQVHAPVARRAKWPRRLVYIFIPDDFSNDHRVRATMTIARRAAHHLGGRSYPLSRRGAEERAERGVGEAQAQKCVDGRE